MMDRRMFLRSLAGAAATVVAPKVYVFAPPSGWTLREGLWATNGHGKSLWVSKTAEEILTDLNAALARARLALPDQYVFMPARFEVLDPKLVRMLRTKRDKEWFL